MLAMIWRGKGMSNLCRCRTARTYLPSTNVRLSTAINGLDGNLVFGDRRAGFAFSYQRHHHQSSETCPHPASSR